MPQWRKVHGIITAMQIKGMPSGMPRWLKAATNSGISAAFPGNISENKKLPVGNTLTREPRQALGDYMFDSIRRFLGLHTVNIAKNS